MLTQDAMTSGSLSVKKPEGDVGCLWGLEPRGGVQAADAKLAVPLRFAPHLVSLFVPFCARDGRIVSRRSCRVTQCIILEYTMFFVAVMLIIEIVILGGIEKRLFRWRPAARLL